MVTSEELTKRWNEIHAENKKKPAPTPEPPAETPASKNGDLAKGGLLAAGSGDGTIERLFRRLKGKIKPPDERLKSPITWIGKLAVGESKDYAGWWEVLLPENPVAISFYGPFARMRALAKAEELKDQYE